jgi:deoxycytidine triphosphate deaminase
MILHDELIHILAANDLVDPYTPNRVQPYSIELSLGAEYRVARSRLGRQLRRLDNWLHSRKFETEKALESDLRWSQPKYGATITIKRGGFYLLHSLENVTMGGVCGLLFLNSGEARNGVEQAHAGFFEAEFAGQAVWEVTNNHPQPITLMVGMRFGQMLLIQPTGKALIGYDKTGHYLGQKGAQTAR